MGGDQRTSRRRLNTCRRRSAKVPSRRQYAPYAKFRCAHDTATEALRGPYSKEEFYSIAERFDLNGARPRSFSVDRSAAPGFGRSPTVGTSISEVIQQL